MIIAHNLAAMNAQRQFKVSGLSKKKSTEKLSSGYKINRAADDAAGLTISETMRRKIRGLNQAADNVQDGISYCQIADGALSEVSDMLNRIEELAVKSANGTNTQADRDAMDKEMQQLVTEMDRVFKSTEFNTLKIWPPVLEPMVSGVPNDYSLFQVEDATGKYYGGIEYMGHNYTWSDLGIGWDPATHTFTSTDTYDVSGKLVKGTTTPSPIDDYDGTAHFNIKTEKDSPADTMIKTYSWNATSEGITIDGILVDDAKWDSGNFAGITPGGKAKAGDYSFEYHGQTIEFGIPEDMDFDDLLIAIGNSQRLESNWVSEPSGTKYIGAVDTFDSPQTRIYIDAANGGKKENIARTYNIIANNDTLLIQNSDGDKPVGTVWTDLDNSGPAGADMYGFGSWGTDVNGDSASKSDSINGGDNNKGSETLAIDENAIFTYGTDFFGKTDRSSGRLEFDFSIKENQTKTDILQDFNSLSFRQSNIVSPTTAYTTNSSQEVWVKSSASNISFYTQRDQLGRAYDTAGEGIASGVVTSDASGKFKVVLSNGSNNYEMTSSVSAATYKDEATRRSNAVRDNINSEYESAAEVRRQEEYETWKKNTSENHFGALKNFNIEGTTKNLAEHIVLSKISTSEITKRLSDEDCESIWGDTFNNNITYVDADGNTQRKSDEEIQALKDKLWDDSKITTDEKKLEIWNDSSKIADAEKEEIWSGADIKYSYINSYLTKNNIDSLVDFTEDEKKEVYNRVRDSHLNDTVIGDKTIIFSGSLNGDSLALTFDLSNIKIDDIKKTQTSDGEAFLEYETRYVDINASNVEDLLKKDFTDSALGTKFDLKSSGASYQDVRFYQNHQNYGYQRTNNVFIENSPVELEIQSGAERDDQTVIRYDNMRAAKLGLNGEHIDTQDGAGRVMDRIVFAQNKVNEERSKFGAYVNGFEHCYDNLNNTSENTQAAESRIRDTDMAKEMVTFTKHNILEQVGISMMAQANQSTQGVMSLLQ